MAKKHKTGKSGAKAVKPSFDLENWPLLTPAVFTIAFLALLILFSGFIFSDNMLFNSDQMQAGVFFRTMLVDYVQEHGAIPQWNPYIFGGMPYVEAFHGDIFYPGSFGKYFLSRYRWQGWTQIIHIFLAGIFMFLAARQFRLSRIASLLSAVCYMFAAYLVSLVAPGHDGKIYVTTLFPLIMLFLERGLKAEQWWKGFVNFSVLGLIIGVIILSPHAQMSYFMLWVVALYTAFHLIVKLKESKSIRPLIRPSVLSAYAVVIGLLISAIQFYPGYAYTTEFSPRSDAKRGWDWAISWSMHEEEAFSQIIPEFSGTRSHSEETYYWGKNAFKDNSESVGIVAIFAALVGFFFYRRKESYFFGGLALFALIYALGATTPMFKLFFHVIPMVKSLRAPSMIMFIFSFSISLLAGMGVQALMKNREKKEKEFSPKFSYLLFGLPGLLFVLAVLFKMNGRGMLSLWSDLFYSEARTTMIQTNMSKLDLAYMNLPAIQTGAWMAFLFAAIAAVLIWLYRSRKAGAWVLAGLILLPVIDGVRFNQRFVHTIDPAQRWSPNPVTQFFEANRGNYRVFNVAGQIIPTDLLPFFGTEVVVGYHGNQLRWYDNLLGGVAKSNQGNPRFLNLVGAKYVLLPGNQQLPQGHLGPESVTVAADFGPLKIWQNDNALPRVYLVDQYEVFENMDEIHNRVLRSGDDLRQIVYLEEQPTQQYLRDTTGADSVWVIDYQTDSVVLGVNCSSNKILVMTDNYYESWHAFVDGSPAPVMRSYGSFRAVEIPAGANEVRFVFESEKYRLGKLATGLTSLYLLVILGLNVYVGRRKRTEERKA